MRTFKYSTIFATLLAMFAISGAVQTASAQKSKPKPKPKVIYYSVKAGSVFHVRLNSDLSSKKSHAGDSFQTTLVDPVYSSGGVVLMPQGTIINGSVYSVKPASKDGKPGTLDVRFISAKLPNGRRATIVGMLTDLNADGTTSDNEGGATAKTTSHRTVKFVGGGAAGGAIIGGIAGGGKGAAIGAGVGAAAGYIGKKLMKGHEAEVKSGTEFGVYLSRSISLPKFQPVTNN